MSAAELKPSTEKQTALNGDEGSKDEKAQAEVAAQVADSAAKLDGTPVQA